MEYGFYLAKIVDVAQDTDNRLGVKVLPYMEGINDTECPLWPSFFKDELFTGKVGDLVWVICDSEFSMGYVFALANYNTYPDIVDSTSSSAVFEKSTDGIALSIPTDLRKNIANSTIEVDGFTLSLENVKVTYWDENCIHYIERSTGGKVIAFNSGSLYIFRQNECLIKIGKNIIKIDSNHISLAGDSVNIQSDDVSLGNAQNLGHVVVTEGSTAEGAYVSKAVRA